ncbi:MAG: NAD(P)/FAD-dependent oxidoreductase [Spirochaetaceae bacterium]|nr:MAG: NAD(P)/FAD-dependent oxidoreductase [Spirochaetaceae bacterium]
MHEQSFDVAVIGGGAAGMAAAVEVCRHNLSCAIVERVSYLGGILLQCIHNGFGLQEFKQELTGPEFAEEQIRQVKETDTALFLDTTVDSMEDTETGKEVYCYSRERGIVKLNVRAVILAMGCRERNRGNIGTPGTRPAGVFTAGLAQRLVNVEGFIPGRNVVIVGSGDIGLIMARRMTWVGARVHAVVEIQPYPSGLTRNIVQCLNDFEIPLYLSHVVSRIEGRDRVERVAITPLENGIPNEEKTFHVPCDTLLLSVGLVPENELSENAGVQLNPQTNGAVVDSTMMTSVPGVFSCGNVLHVHDLADYVAEEARRTGAYVAAWLDNERPSLQIPIRAGANVRYVSPGRFNPERPDKLYLRTLIVKNNARLVIKLDNQVVKEKKVSHLQPSEMVSLKLQPKDVESWKVSEDSVLEVSVQ